MRLQHMEIYAETLAKLQADHFSAKYHELEALLAVLQHPFAVVPCVCKLEGYLKRKLFFIFWLHHF